MNCWKGKSETFFELFDEFCISAGKLLITPLILVLGLALGAVAVVIGKSYIYE